MCYKITTRVRKGRETMVYVVTGDGCLMSGSYMYLVGVFTNREMAEAAAHDTHMGKVTEIPLGTFFPLRKDKYDYGLENDYLLGGFEE